MQEMMKRLELSEIAVRKRIGKIKSKLKIVNTEVGAYCLSFQLGININKKKYDIDKNIITQVETALRGSTSPSIEKSGNTKTPPRTQRKTNQKSSTKQKQSHKKPYFILNDAKNALKVIKKSDTIQLSKYAIIGNYVRFEEKTINDLKDLKQKIIQSVGSKSKTIGNFLIWGSPGTGKTYLIDQIAKSQNSIAHHVLNLADLNSTKFKSQIIEIEKAEKNCICLIDEVDSESSANWIYEFLLPHLLPLKKRKFKICFVLAGSGMGSLEKMKEKIKTNNKGPDCLSRIPDANQYSISTPDIGDRLLAIASQLLNQSKEKNNFETNKIEKLALFYILVSPQYFGMRQIEQLLISAVAKIDYGEDRMMYDHLFEYGDYINKEFWLQANTLDSKLSNSFIHIKKN
jgi:hypothetical protein